MPSGGPNVSVGGIEADVILETGAVAGQLATVEKAMAKVSAKVKQLQKDFQAAGGPSPNYEKQMGVLLQAQARLTKKSDDLRGSLKDLTKAGNGLDTSKAVQGLRQLTYAADDLQYGFSAVLNNIPQILGPLGNVGVAAGAVATGLGLLYLHWDKVREAFGDDGGSFAKAEKSLDGLKDRVKALKEELEGFPRVGAGALARSTERQSEQKTRAAEAVAMMKEPTEGEKEEQRRVADVIKEQPGGHTETQRKLAETLLEKGGPESFLDDTTVNKATQRTELGEYRHSRALLDEDTPASRARDAMIKANPNGALARDRKQIEANARATAARYEEKAKNNAFDKADAMLGDAATNEPARQHLAGLAKADPARFGTLGDALDGKTETDAEFKKGLDERKEAVDKRDARLKEERAEQAAEHKRELDLKREFREGNLGVAELVDPKFKNRAERLQSRVDSKELKQNEAEAQLASSMSVTNGGLMTESDAADAAKDALARRRNGTDAETRAKDRAKANRERANEAIPGLDNIAEDMTLRAAMQGGGMEAVGKRLKEALLKSGDFSEKEAEDAAGAVAKDAGKKVTNRVLDEAQHGPRDDSGRDRQHSRPEVFDAGDLTKRIQAGIGAEDSDKKKQTGYQEQMVQHLAKIAQQNGNVLRLQVD